MNKRFVMVLLAALTLSVQAFAQNVVTGKVSDNSGEVLPGAFVQVKGTNTGTTTDLDGRYELNAPANATLVFSFIGFETQEVAVGNQKTVNVVLAPDSMQLDEVVFVGYGTARKRDVSGAIASVNYGSDQNISSLPNPNALAGLSSRIAGFTYSPTESAGGDNTSTMTIRGMNAIPTGGSVSASSQSVNKPLLVIDGVLSYDSINSINTADIESIDVLKDASAAAIYGSRAANGVIVITTKRGTSAKPTVNFNASLSLSDWSRLPKFVTNRETFLKNIFYTKKATVDRYADMEWSDYADIDAAATDLITSQIQQDAWSQGIWNNWIDLISRTGVGQKYDVNVGGREKNIRYYVSGDYTRQEGIRLGDDYEKYGALAKMDIDLASWLTVGVKANMLSSNSWGTVARIQNATWMSPLSFQHPYFPGDEELTAKYANWANTYPDGSTVNPLIGSGVNDSNLYTDNRSRSLNLNAVAYAQIDFPFIPGLSYKFTAQTQRNSSYHDIFNSNKAGVNTTIPADMDNPSKFDGKTSGSSSQAQSRTWNIDNILTYTKDFGLHHVDFMAGYTREAYVSNGLSVGFSGYSVPSHLGVYTLDVANSWTPKRSRTDSQAIGYLFRANYNYANKYYASFSFRRDGYSAFGVNTKWGNFFGASGAWVLSNEDFIKDLNVFDFLKLRLSWGQNGSRSISPYQTSAYVVKSSNGQAVGGTMAWLDNQSTLGMATNNLPNANLSWATVEKFDVGVDFAVLGSRINGSIDVYTGTTTNMLVERSAPYFSGFKQTPDNVGKVTNNGIELSINTVNINGNGRDTFRWESNIVLDHNTNKLVELFGKGYDGTEADDVANATSYGFDSYYALQVGRPIGAGYDVKMLGIFNSQEEIDAYVDENGNAIQGDAKPGDIKFEDYNGDGKINANDRHYVGSPDPLFVLNFGNTLSWKNFSLYFNFRWAQGDKNHFLWFNPNAYGTSFGTGNQLADVKPWTTTNHSQTYPRYGWGSSTTAQALNYQFWSQRSFLKLKDLVFSYTLDQNLTRKVGLEKVRFYVSGTDLFTITGWKGLDPENAGTIAANAASSRFGKNGTYKTYTFGVNLTF